MHTLTSRACACSCAHRPEPQLFTAAGSLPLQCSEAGTCPLTNTNTAPHSRSSATLYTCWGLLFSAAATAGLLALRSTYSPHPRSFTAELSHDPLLYIYVSSTLSSALAGFGFWVGQRVDTLRAQSITDPLTGLTNRRYWMGRLQAEVKRSGRSGTPLAVLIIDVDKLKAVNDTYGHEAGDTVLRTVAAVMARVCRSTDVVARLGGDEFGVLAPDTTAQQAARLADRLRAALHAHSSSTVAHTSSNPSSSAYRSHGSDSDKTCVSSTSAPASEQPPVLARALSVSIGVSDLSLAQCDAGPEAVVRAADAALYAAKHSGRNRVAVSSGSGSKGAVCHGWDALCTVTARHVDAEHKA